jgi:hypothetical protein
MYGETCYDKTTAQLAPLRISNDMAPTGEQTQYGFGTYGDSEKMFSALVTVYAIRTNGLQREDLHGRFIKMK